MDDYCPLCLKVGNKKKMRAIQVNYEEAVLLCEEERCPWPYGYEEFKFIPRRIEELSKKPPSKAESNKHKESTAISTNLGVYTPPVTPSSDNGKIDNLGLTPPNNINSTFIGKISPTYRFTVLPTSQLVPQEENSHMSIEKLHDNLSKPVSSIFDIDSSVSAGKIALLATKQGPGSTICDGKPPKKEVETKIMRKKLKHVPQIRSIETIPNNLIKIEIREDLLTNLSTPTGLFSPSKSKNQTPSSANTSSTPKTRKRPLIPETNESINFDPINEVPKKILRVSNDDINEPMVVNQISNPSGATNPKESGARTNGDDFLQSNNYLEIINFEGGNNSMENSGQEGLGFNGFFDDMLLENSQNVTQEIDDDWLTSMLI